MREVLQRSNGANFVLADLHFHSPGDARFLPGMDLNTKEQREEYAKQFVQSAIDKNLSLLGITDHNSVAWVDHIRAAAEGTTLTVFPGFEISAESGAGGIHVVCLFNPDEDKDRLDDIITELGLPRDRRFHDDGSPRVCTKSLDDVIRLIYDRGGLPIAAHVLSDHGILRTKSMTGEIRVRAWCNPELLAAELPRARSTYLDERSFAASVIRNETGLYHRERPIAFIYSSDGRSAEDLASNPTLIKLSSNTIDGLRHAFLDWESRVRHPDEVSNEPFSRIVAAKWIGGFLDGLEIHFNRNLNCLVGGKGTGKSAILESIRYAFDKNPIGTESRRQHQQIVDEVFGPGSSIEILVEHHSPRPALYVVCRDHGKEPKVYRWDDERMTKGAELRLHPSDFFDQLEVYGQKEVLELSNEEAIQVRLLSRFRDQRKRAALKAREDDILAKLRHNASAIIASREEMEQIELAQQESRSLAERKRRFEESGLAALFEEKQKYVWEERLFERLNDALAGAAGHIQSFTEGLSFGARLIKTSVRSDLPHEEMFLSICGELRSLEKEVEGLISEIEKKRSSGLLCISKAKRVWDEANQQQEKRYREALESALSDNFDPRELVQIEERLAELDPIVQRKGKAESELTQLFAERGRLLADLRQCRMDDFTELEKAAQHINRELDGIVHVDVTFEGNRGDLVNELADLKSGARRDQIDLLVHHDDFTLETFAEAIRKGEYALADQFGITKSASSSLYRRCSEEVLLELEVVDIPTAIEIFLNIGKPDSPKYKSTQHLSVGQRCTAILLIILLHNEYPLLIDQPEDDLDNSFVYTDIVKRLRKEKERRQFIIATHNANVPVLGDAELIQVLEAESGQLQPSGCCYGSIDESNLREPVERILEGGREAFLFRKDKYGV